MTVEIDPTALDHDQRYKVMTGGIVPRPIAWVTTVGPNGICNAAPYSFFNGASVTPMMVMIGPANRRDGTSKDTLHNIEKTGEFVVNVVTEPHAHLAAATAEDLGPEESELAFVGLQTSPSKMVGPPRIAVSPISFECAEAQIIPFGPGIPNAGNVVFGRVVWIAVADPLIDEGYRIDPNRLRAVGRMAGRSYVSTRQITEIARGREALDFEPPSFS